MGHTEYMRGWYKEKPGYKSWQHMKYRCLVPSSSKWPRYGGRGITIFSDWIESYESFIAYMGPPPGPGYSIERDNNDGNYEPGNVRWLPLGDQYKNRGTTKHITFNGETKSIADWARCFGVSTCCIQKRLRRNCPLDAPIRVTMRPNKGLICDG